MNKLKSPIIDYLATKYFYNQEMLELVNVFCFFFLDVVESVVQSLKINLCNDQVNFLYFTNDFYQG